jgi:hypothetical protein
MEVKATLFDLGLTLALPLQHGLIVMGSGSRALLYL